MDNSGTPCYDSVGYVDEFVEELPVEEKIGDFVDIGQDEITAARLAEPDTDGFEKLTQIEVDEARRATRLDYLFDLSAAAARIDAALDGINSVSVMLADEALALAEKVSSAGNGYGIFEVKQTDEELLAELSQSEDDGWA